MENLSFVIQPTSTSMAQTIWLIALSRVESECFHRNLPRALYTLRLQNSEAISVIAIQGSAEVLKLVSDISITLIHPFNNPIK